MTQPLQSLASPLRWNTDIVWTSEEHSDNTSMLVFQRAGLSILKLEVGPELIKFLANFVPGLDDPATRQMLENPQVLAFLQLLKAQRILRDTTPLGVPHEQQAAKAQPAVVSVTLYAGQANVVASWQLPAERALSLDILVGDEARLCSLYDGFAGSRPAGHLVSFIKIYHDMIELGAVRFPYEKAVPATRTPVAMHYPAWLDRLEQALGLVKDFYAEAVSTTKWHSLTTHGSRMAWVWEEAKSPYRVMSTTMSQLSESVPFFHWRSQVEGEVGAGGVGTTVVAAEFSASCEAWERYCLARSDLAPSAEALEAEAISPFPGVHYDYLRAQAKPIKRSPAWVAGWTLAHHRPVKVPTEWIYFNGHNSVANSNGAAFGSSLADAVFGAKIEVVERHLLMQSYLQLSQGREFTPAPGEVDPAIGEFLRSHHRRARFYDIGTSNAIHAVVCVVGADLPPFASIGCAAKASKAEATRKALYEAVVTDSQWSRRIEQLGPKGFVARGRSFLAAPPKQVGFEESAWYWAASEDSEERLHRRFHTGTPPFEALDEELFVAVDIGSTLVPNGAVVKVIHPDALPLPSCFAQAQQLFSLLNLSETLTIPMF